MELARMPIKLMLGRRRTGMIGAMDKKTRSLERQKRFLNTLLMNFLDVVIFDVGILVSARISGGAVKELHRPSH